MQAETIRKNVEILISSLPNENKYGEKINIVGATKMQTVEDINVAISSGIKIVAENKVQEFREKHGKLIPCTEHFIGHLQTNKVKYLIGNVSLIHSCDRDELLQEISVQSHKKDVVTNVLLQVNIGNEESKGGYSVSEIIEKYEYAKTLPNVKVKGFMAMLPVSDDEEYLTELVKTMRNIFEKVKSVDNNIEYLSMGMSGDYKLCIENGSNMVRIGTGIFGARDYNNVNK